MPTKTRPDQHRIALAEVELYRADVISRLGVAKSAVSTLAEMIASVAYIRGDGTLDLAGEAGADQVFRFVSDRKTDPKLAHLFTQAEDSSNGGSSLAEIAKMTPGEKLRFHNERNKPAQYR